MACAAAIIAREFEADISHTRGSRAMERTARAGVVQEELPKLADALGRNCHDKVSNAPREKLRFRYTLTVIIAQQQPPYGQLRWEEIAGQGATETAQSRIFCRSRRRPGSSRRLGLPRRLSTDRPRAPV